MTISEVFDEEYVRLLLDGSEEEVAQGVRLIHEHLAEGMWGYVRKHFPGLKSQDLEDVWAESLMALSGIIVAGRFDTDRKLGPLLYELVRRKATDQLRRQTASDKFIEGMSESLAGTAAGRHWSRLSPVEREETMELIRQAVAELPTRQQEVMETYVDNFPDSKIMETLRELVSERASKPVTLASVKRALQEARGKVREFLNAKGYGDVG